VVAGLVVAGLVVAGLVVAGLVVAGLVVAGLVRDLDVRRTRYIVCLSPLTVGDHR
jgi:GLTT repeat (6 copies)